MIRISVEVGRGATRNRVAVQAESIERALEIAKAKGAKRAMMLKVSAFPIEPEAFFVWDTAATTGPVKQVREVA